MFQGVEKLFYLWPLLKIFLKNAYSENKTKKIGQKMTKRERFVLLLKL